MSLLGPLLDATAFLTRVPLPARGRFDLARAAWAFPLVGGGTGLALGGLGVLLAHLLGEDSGAGVLVAAVVVVLAEVLLTGALHLDGLADCADGTGGRDRAARLRIMKDHTVGVYGVTAVVLDLLLKVALVGVLLERLPAGELGTAAVLVTTTLAWTLSRTAMLPPARWLPYAREDGTGRSLVEGLTTRRVVGALTVAGMVLVLVLVLALGAVPVVLADGPPAGAVVTQVMTEVATEVVVMVVAALLAGLAVARWARRTLGGVTGDVLGTTAEVTLVAALLAAVLLD